MHGPRVLKALGTLLVLFSLALLVPTLGSLVWDSDVSGSAYTERIQGTPLMKTTVAFFATFLLTVLLGILLVFLPREDLRELREREAYAIVGFSYLLFSVVGAIPFLLTGSMQSPMAALFEAMSGLTTTGATALRFPLEQYPPSLMLWRATLNYLGGMGIVVLSVAILSRMTAGAYKLLPAEMTGGSVTRLQPKVAQTAKALWVVYLGITAIATAILVLLLRFGAPQMEWRVASFEAITTAFSGISTGGFHAHTDSIGFYHYAPVTWAVLLLMLAGATSFNLWYVAAHGRPKRLFADSEFRFLIAIWATATLVMTYVLVESGGRFPNAFENAAFHSGTFLTGGGFTTMNVDVIPDAGKLLAILLMVTGGSLGSTAGAMKVFRIYILLKLAAREMQRLLHPSAIANIKVFGHILPDDTIRRTFVFFFTYLTILMAGAFGFLLLFDFPFLDAIATSANLIGNVGQTFGVTSSNYASIPPLAQLMSYVLMWLGRLEIFTALLLFVPATYRD